ncbi:cobalt-precorrin 5A hydrolase [Clostridium sp. SHJSY1]|uniref:cobalt-precorrin 5A hydrolase n=1 Tax=Clostridium sp. SHJSY1 TaxID=2942483 RepID=UPI0028769F8C|nr:cobalt-precorrin 5A hydrolase [Clostridium sp. SHJSY1]MDS0526575.1 cobalt-precorrin 5A hydrolase [Clostridium sp. SHJSY1]
MEISLISFTQKGSLLNKKLSCSLSELGYNCESFTTYKSAEELELFSLKNGLKNWTEEHFYKKEAIIFIGAIGIAVRAIAPFVKSKTTDPAIVVIDELGKFTIPILSGHIGGANSLTEKISSILNSTPVITTATDINDKFSVDVFAKKENLYISDMTMAKKISSEILDNVDIGVASDYKIKGKVPKELKILENGEIGVCISVQRKSPFVNTLNLIPKILTLGIGCRRDTSIDKIENLVMKVLDENNISISAVKNVASIDLKKDEKGLIQFVEKYGFKFITYTADELNALEGNFSESTFVKSVTGVSNVCERAATLGSNNGKLIIKKRAENGVTVAISEEDWSVSFE